VSQAVWVRATGGPEVLSLESASPAEPGPGTVRVRSAAAGVNFIDVYFRTGLYPRPLPFVLGLEGAGTIEAVGEGVAGFAPGDRVAWASAPGSYADHVIAPARMIVPVPDGIASDVAAAAMLQGMTAHYLTHGVRETRPGDVALVHAAAGGVGLLLVQMLKAAGATVVGVSLDSISRLNDFSADPKYCAGKLPVASDSNGAIAKSFNVMVHPGRAGLKDVRGVEIGHGFAERTTFVLKPDGTIAATIGGVAPADNVHKTLAAVEALNHGS